MGWTETQATYKKQNGKVDFKREFDEMFTGAPNPNFDQHVLKSTVVSARWGGGRYEKVYYAAVETCENVYMASTINDGTDGRKVWCAVVLIASPSEPYYDYMYKRMNDSSCPSEDGCPASILNLLTSTDDRVANEWRSRCQENADNKSFAYKLSRLPIGSSIVWTVPEETDLWAGDTHITPGTKLTLDREAYGKTKKWCARSANFFVPNKYLTKESVKIWVQPKVA